MASVKSYGTVFTAGSLQGPVALLGADGLHAHPLFGPASEVVEREGFEEDSFQNASLSPTETQRASLAPFRTPKAPLGANKAPLFVCFVPIQTGKTPLPVCFASFQTPKNSPRSVA